NTSETAKSPIKTANKSNPALKLEKPKVNLSAPSIGAEPTIARQMPITPLINPFITDLPIKLIIIVSENIPTAKYSNGPNFTAKLARIGDININTTMLINPPTNEN